MDISNLRKKLTGVGGGFLFAVMALQPPLDVLSYFMNEYGSTDRKSTRLNSSHA